MQEEILTRIDALAEKLGVAAQELFAIYVRQAPLEFVDVAAVAVVLIIIGLLFKYSLSKMIKEEQFDDSGWWIVTGVTCVALFIFVAVEIGETAQAIKAVLNPEYYAITHLSELIK